MPNFAGHARRAGTPASCVDLLLGHARLLVLHDMSDSNDSDDLDWDPDRERALRKIDRAARERLTPQGPRKSIKERKAEYAQWKASRDLVAQASTVSLFIFLLPL